MDSIVLFIEKGASSQPMSCVAGPPAADGSIEGRVINQPDKALLPYLAASLEGKLYTFVPGKRYRVEELTAEGNFKLIPYL